LFLTIGLVLIAIFIGFFSIPYIPQGEEISVKNLSDSYLVGEDERIASRTEKIIIGISRQSTNSAAEIEEKELYNGLFFGKNRIIKHLSVRDVQRLKIKFDVESTNAYGNLVIKINGRIVKNQIFYEGSYEIIFDQNLSDEMNVEIFCTSSGWRLWAPTVYKLKNITLTSEGYIDNEKLFTFTLDDEYANFLESRLNFVLDENMGEMYIELNGHEVYSGAVNSLASFTLNRLHFQRGENRLLFKAKDDSKFDGKAFLNIIYKKKTEKIFATTFNISKSQYSNMKRGCISFDIISVKKSGGFVIKIGSYKEFDKAEERTYTFYFTKEDVVNGTNQVIIQSLDNAIFYIKNFEVKIER